MENNTILACALNSSAWGKFKAKMIGIYHIGPKDDVNIIVETVLMLNEQGKMITIPYE